MAAPKTPRSDTPPRVDFNLDSLEREGTTEPFVVVLDGGRVEFSDPTEHDWQTLMQSMRDPYAFMRLVIADEDSRTAFLAASVPQWKMAKLMDAYLSRYGMTQSGEAPASRS